MERFNVDQLLVYLVYANMKLKLILFHHSILEVHLMYDIMSQHNSELQKYCMIVNRELKQISLK